MSVASRSTTPATSTGRVQGGKTLRATWYAWSRRLHLWLSTASLLIVLFFALTGLTLNHPGWTFGIEPTVSDVERALPPDVLSGGEVDWLALSEHLRAQEGVQGRVTDRYQDEYGAQLGFRAPGYAADAFLDYAAGTYRLITEQSGVVAAMNDLHRGKTGPGWRLAMDVASVILAAISVTGLILLLSLKKLRPTGLTLIAIGTVATVIVMGVAIR